MSVYEKVLSGMMAKDGLKSKTDIQETLGANCANLQQYFKPTTVENCIFRTSDGVWWDITNPDKVIVSFKREDLTAANADDFNNKKAYYLLYSIDNGGAIRINDLGYETNQESDNRNALIKLYNTTNNMKGQEIVPQVGLNHPLYQSYANGTLNECSGDNYSNCYTNDTGSWPTKAIVDENGYRLGDDLSTLENNTDFGSLINYDYLEYERNANGDVTKYNLYKDGELKVSYDTWEEVYSLTESSGMMQKMSERCEYFADSNYCSKYKYGKGDIAYTCYAKGTQITLADGSTKNVEDITFEDELRVWDFDNGCMASSKPLFIKKPEIAEQYNLLTFSDGRTLKTINQHRIFNKEAGKYTYPMTDDTPIGTTTLLDDGTEVTLADKKYVYEPVEYYNIITNYHMNCFASGISTSCRLNNIYPIKDYKFVKEERKLIPYEDFHDIPRKWYEGLRLAEQSQKINNENDVVFDKSLNDYVTRLIRTNDESKHLTLV